MSETLPPFPTRDLNTWAMRLYEYMVSQSPAKGRLDPSPILLSHKVDAKMERATTDGLLLYDPALEKVVFSKAGAWLPIYGGETGTNLTYTVATRVIASDTGTDATLPLVTGADAGLMSSADKTKLDAGLMLSAADKTKLDALIGTNTGDQTSIVGITGTKAQFNAAASDGDFLFVGDLPAPSIARYFGKIDASYALTSTTAVQKLLNCSANGALTLPIGQYEFACVFAISGMSATSGNGSFSLAGTATLGDTRFSVLAADASAFPATALINSAGGVTSIAITTAGTGTQLSVRIAGTFEVSVEGTIIPSIALTTAIAATVGTGSYFACTRLGDAGVNTAGTWT